MDLNGDGHLDILSGSYSRQDRNMAGLFQVLWGNKDGTFRAAEVLKGTGGEPLIIPTGGGEHDVTDKICTRPFAVDLDGDGKLDIVSGNFSGTFAWFRGEGGGKFAPKATWLEADGARLSVPSHSDPFFVDWDGDGDLDMVSGSAQGGVFLFPNVGSKQQPVFGKRVTLLEPVGHLSEATTLGDAHVTRPGAATRVWVDDIDGDGKLDLLIGDSVSLVFPAKGVAEASVKAQLAEWSTKQAKLFESRSGTPSEADQKKFDDDHAALQKEREKIVRDERTGFVWVLYGK
ncbi:MAG TPA: VCBS repeat-containing protein [Planctomycetota bacterium]|nr:VCBS repeat-containing protein [Planctomycetota bacterium]